MSTSLLEVSGIGPAAESLLTEHGIKSAEDLAAASLATIMAVPKFSEIRANRVIAAAKAVVEGAPAAFATEPLQKSAAVKKPAKNKSTKKEKSMKKDVKKKDVKKKDVKKKDVKKKDVKKKDVKKKDVKKKDVKKK
ncbi:MAG: helix-hairpin-helix domain-containing protein [Desulfuromonadales bacterium]|nr:helix-hairpin-helix domain-containing protein [Desulfuromonadales bacterium]